MVLYVTSASGGSQNLQMNTIFMCIFCMYTNREFSVHYSKKVPSASAPDSLVSSQRSRLSSSLQCFRCSHVPCCRCSYLFVFCSVLASLSAIFVSYLHRYYFYIMLSFLTKGQLANSALTSATPHYVTSRHVKATLLSLVWEKPGLAGSPEGKFSTCFPFVPVRW